MKQFVMEQCQTGMCHASTVLKLGGDEFLVAWFGGTKEGADDTDIWCSRGKNGSFSAPYRIAEGKEACWNPVLFRLDEKRILLFYKVGSKIASWQTFVKMSEDNGASFGDPFALVPGDRGGRGPVRNKPIRTSDGMILAPASTEKGIWTAFIDRSADEGKTWTSSPPISIRELDPLLKTETQMVYTGERIIPVSEQSFYGRGVIQPTLWEGDRTGEIHALLRSTEGAIYRTDSTDGGKTWTDAYRTGLPNNNSGIDLVKAFGRLFLVCNPVAGNWGERSPLTLSVSGDNGVTWRTLLHLEEGKGEYAYPAIIADEEAVYVTYTYNRQNIAFCIFTKEELIHE